MNDKNKLGLVPCIALVAGGCIGSAIFSLSGMTMYYAGPAAIISWLISALIMGFYGMHVAELSVRFPKSGGTFVYPQKAFGGSKGELLGFISAWGYIVSNIIAVAFSAIYVGTYLSAGFSAITDKMQIPLALIATAFCIVLNLLKITDAGRFNNILVGGLALTMIIYGCVAIFGGTFNSANFVPFMTQGIKGATGWITAIPVASVAYGSCIALAFMVEDIENPNKTIPKAIITGLIIVTCLYMLLIVGTLGNLNVGILMDDSNAFFRYVPIFAALWTSALGKYTFLAPLVSIAALLALVTTMLVLLAICSRNLQAIAQAGYFPKKLGENSSNGVPAAATIVVGIFCLLLCLKPDWTEILVGLGALFSVITIVITVAALLKARQDTKLSADQYQAPGGHILPWLTILVLTLCYIPDIIAGSWKLLGFTVLIYAIGFVIYYIGSSKKKA